MRSNSFVRAAGALALVGLGSCDKAGKAIGDAPEALCGPCGDLDTGDVSISGNARIDGLFSAINTLSGATLSVRGDFEAHVAAIGEAFGVTRAEGTSLADFVAEVKAEIEAEITAHVEGGLRVDYQPPRCSANVEVAVQAQAQCQASVDVDCEPPTVEPGSVSVQCEGSCTGGCEGMCEGSCSVEVSGGGCEGSCEGSCEITKPGVSCEGTCRGTCSGTCSLTNAQGQCQGDCDGECQGSCELKPGGASCDGNCHGSCVAPMASAECSGQCRGSCSASCSGSCEGEVKPPMVTGGGCDADVAAECEVQASAQASASLDCTPPSLTVDFAFAADVDASAQAAFTAKMRVFKDRMIAIGQGFAKLKGLVGEISAEGGIEIEGSALGQVIAAVEANISVDAIAEIDIPPGRLPCVVPAAEKALTQLRAIPDDVGGTLSGQAELIALISG